MTLLAALAVFVTLAPPGWAVGNLIGWWTVRVLPWVDYPFSWRVFLGPWAYFGWLDGPDGPVPNPLPPPPPPDPDVSWAAYGLAQAVPPYRDESESAC